LAGNLDLPLDVRVRNLSKGNKQKVGLVQALMHRPALLLLDEPTAGLDPLVQQAVLGLLRQARDSGATVFFSSHVLSEVEAICDRVGIIRGGRMVEVASTGQLVQRAVRRVRVRFRSAVEAPGLEQVPGVRLLARDGATTLLLEVEGEMEHLLQALAALPVVDLDTERPSLEDAFLAYYAASPQEAG
jgi:ABC-2 type transport system ATP-binding protein